MIKSTFRRLDFFVCMSLVYLVYQIIIVIIIIIITIIITVIIITIPSDKLLIYVRYEKKMITFAGVLLLLAFR